MSTRPDKLPYDREKFVDRKKILEEVKEKARCIADGFSVERRVVIFHGQRGAGKTWLLEELKNCLCEYTAPCLIVLDRESEIETIRSEIPKKRPLVLLLDEVNAPDHAFLNELLERVLAPLVQEKNVLIILAQRGQPHFWTAPEFREKADEFDLKPFTLGDTKEQIKKQVSEAEEKSDVVVSRTGGYPWANYILASHLPDEKSGLECCTELFLKDVKKELRPYFKILSILQAFDETRMEFVLPFYPWPKRQTWNYVVCRDMRKALVNTTLAKWREEARGYVLDEPLRIVLEALLREQEFDQWVRLHSAAYRMYTDWAEKYEQSRAWWTKEAQYHDDKLKDADHDPVDCPEGDQEEEKDDA
jgi:hypothetical protein